MTASLTIFYGYLTMIFKKPNYDHIAVNSKITLEITAQQVKAIFWAYDHGLAGLDSDALEQLKELIANIKDELWS
ncbi:hypothetical protein OURE66S_01217 [Oligella ureolytica]